MRRALGMVSIVRIVSFFPCRYGSKSRNLYTVRTWTTESACICVLYYICDCDWYAYSIFTNASSRTGYDTRSIFKWSLTGLNSEFSFSYTRCRTKAEKPSLPYYLPIDGGRIIGFIPFPIVLVLCEMQSVSSKIWTRVAVSISYDDNHYTTGTSLIWV